MATKYGTSGYDYLVGTSNADKLFGYGGNDWLIGGYGADTLDGGGGRDILSGNNVGSAYKGEVLAWFVDDKVPDTLRGNWGADLFIVGKNDILADFNVSQGDVRLTVDDANYGLTHLGSWEYQVLDNFGVI